MIQQDRVIETPLRPLRSGNSESPKKSAPEDSPDASPNPLVTLV